MSFVSQLQRVCAWDECHTFVPASHNATYCPKCGCKRKAENSRKQLGNTSLSKQTKLEKEIDLFEEGRKFQEIIISDVPDGYKILVVNDTQIPFQDNKTLNAVEKFWNDFSPDLEIYNGDIADFYSISVFDKNPSRMFRFKDEVKTVSSWLRTRAEANPDSRRIFIEGNHEDRLRRWLWKRGPELSGLDEIELENLLHFSEIGMENVPYGSVVDFLGYRIEHGQRTSQSKAYPMNVSRYMAIAVGSSGLCGHSHHFSTYSWTDSEGSHSYIENGCLCRFNLEYAAFPNWQQSFTYGVAHKGNVHLVPVQIYPTGFMAEGEFYPR